MYLAGNPNTDPALLIELATSPHAAVRYAASHNPHTPPSTLARLTDDPNANVRDAAEDTRQWLLDTHINQLTGRPRELADMLADTFTGWPEDLDTLLTTLTRPVTPRPVDADRTATAETASSVHSPPP